MHALGVAGASFGTRAVPSELMQPWASLMTGCQKAQFKSKLQDGGISIVVAFLPVPTPCIVSLPGPLCQTMYWTFVAVTHGTLTHPVTD